MKEYWPSVPPWLTLSSLEIWSRMKFPSLEIITTPQTNLTAQFRQKDNRWDNSSRGETKLKKLDIGWTFFLSNGVSISIWGVPGCARAWEGGIRKCKLWHSRIIILPHSKICFFLSLFHFACLHFSYSPGHKVSALCFMFFWWNMCLIPVFLLHLAGGELLAEEASSWSVCGWAEGRTHQLTLLWKLKSNKLASLGSTSKLLPSDPALQLGLAMPMQNMRNMRIMRICGIFGCGCRLKISSTYSTYRGKKLVFLKRNRSSSHVLSGAWTVNLVQISE